MVRTENGFTLIELLVAMTIAAVITGLALPSFLGARKAARDGKRKADIEQIRSALEIYRADCQTYPADATLGTQLIGAEAVCSGNVYMAAVPSDPSAGGSYSYHRETSNSYKICAHLEVCDSTCSVYTDCGSGNCGSSCNYQQTNP